jgi:hypothetical protein
MSFDVHLLPSTATPDDFGDVLRATLRSIGATDDLETIVMLADGASLEIFRGDDPRPGAMLAFRGFGLSHAQAIFVLADATACFIITDGEQGTFKTPATGEAPDDYPQPFVEVADGAALLALVEAGFAAWSDYRDQVVGRAPPQSFFGRLWSRLTGRGA